MLRSLFRFLAVVGFLTITGIVAVLYVAFGREETPPERIVLSFDLSQSLTEAADGGFEETWEPRLTLTDVLDALERAEADPRVKGALVRFGGDVFGDAKAHDLRAAVERFRASGRFALAWAESFGEGRSGASALATAAAFDEIHLQPMGLVSLNWPTLTVPFFRGALEHVGVTPQMEKREAYKTMADTFTERGLTPEHREMLTSLTAAMGEERVAAVARGRRLPPETVRALMDQSPLSDAQALQGRLVDRLSYRDEAIKEAERRAGEGAELLHPLDYLSLVGRPHDQGALVAVIHAVGEISDGDNDRDGFDGLNAHARRLTRAFAAAAADPEVRAILFRIDSPGGSAGASESIRRALTLAQKAGKPVVASMGDFAASGGYWIAMDADRIIAAPGTLTGSIGVVTGKFPLQDAFAKLGVDWAEVSAGPAGGYWSPMRPWTPEERARTAARADEIYAAFLQRVGDARKMSADAVRAAAQGRVWTGAQAKELGLTDEPGGRREALAAVRTAAKLPADAPLELRPYPEPASILDQLSALFSHDGGFAGLLRLTSRLAAAAPQIEYWARPAADVFAPPVPTLTLPLTVGPLTGGPLTGGPSRP